MTISRWEKETELSIKHEYINKLSDYFNVVWATCLVMKIIIPLYQVL